MVAGVLFDLDGTLLDIDIDSFLARYMRALSHFIADVSEGSVTPEAIGNAVLAGTRTMMGSHEGTNRDAFDARVLELVGLDLKTPHYVEALDHFYGERFPLLREGLGPIGGARRAVETAVELGITIALATHPVFPVAAIRERMRWAGVDDLPFAAITTYETMSATKPHAAYYSATAELIGIDPARCVMVGDDLDLDLPARATGMRVFHHDPALTGAAGDRADWAGSMADFAALLPRIVA